MHARWPRRRPSRETKFSFRWIALGVAFGLLVYVLGLFQATVIERICGSFHVPFHSLAGTCLTRAAGRVKKTATSSHSRLSAVASTPEIDEVVSRGPSPRACRGALDRSSCRKQSRQLSAVGADHLP
jgi:hypothetical protein